MPTAFEGFRASSAHMQLQTPSPSVTEGVILESGTTATDWIIVGIIFASAIASVVVARKVVHKLESRFRIQPAMSILIIRFWAILVGLIAVGYAFRQLGVRVGPLLGALGIGGLIMAMSLQHVLGNLAGSVLLHARRPIRRGDQISSNGHEGTVIDINGRAVVMMSFDGERIHLPNLKVLDEPLINQTANDYRRTVIPFQVSYDTDLRRAQRALTQAFRELDSLEDAPAADVIVTGFGASGIDLAARIWHPSEELSARWAVSEVAVSIHETLQNEGIQIPFPQLVLHQGNGALTSSANHSDAADIRDSDSSRTQDDNRIDLRAKDEHTTSP